MESAAIQDILEVRKVISRDENEDGKVVLHRIVSMLTKLGRREYCVGEKAEVYGDYDNDHDNELSSESQASVAV